MPDSLEYIVRPYQTPSPHGVLIIPSTPGGSRQPATLTWGAPGTMPEVNEVNEGVAFEVVCCQESIGEQSRTSETKRITQEGNPDNWVDVRRPISVKLKKKEDNKCGGVSDISIAAQEVNATLGEFEEAINSGTHAPIEKKNCAVTWKFKNEPEPA